jgi:hypothetical protein
VALLLSPHHTLAAMPPKKAHPLQVGRVGFQAIVKVLNPLKNWCSKRVEGKTGVPGFAVDLSRCFCCAPTENPGNKPLSGGNRAQNIPHRPFYPAGAAGYITLGRT